MARLSYQARKALPDRAFALPRERKLPLTNARGNLDRAHIGNAAARLSMMRHRRTISPKNYLRARRAILRAEREMHMGHGHARENPVHEFVTEHPWMTFFLGLAGLNTIGWIAVAAIAAAKEAPASAGGVTYAQDNAVPLPAGAPLNVKVGQSVAFVEAPSGGTEVQVAATTTNSAVLAPAPGVTGGFVAIAPGIATLTSTASGVTSLVTVIAATGTAGVGKAAGKKPRKLSLVSALLRVG